MQLRQQGQTGGVCSGESNGGAGPTYAQTPSITDARTGNCSYTDNMHANNIGLDLSSSLGYAVNKTAKALAHALSTRLQPMGLTPVQLVVLSVIAAEPGIVQKDLSERTGVDRASLAELVRRLEERAMIRREQDADDSRKMRIHPLLDTDRLGIAADEARAVNAQAVRGFTRAEIDSLMSALRRVQVNLDEVPR